MEILTESVSNESFWMAVILALPVAFLSLALAISGIYELFKDFEWSTLIVATGIALLSAFFWATGFALINEEPDVTHKVIIDDYNEVYEQGYEIVSKDGAIYTIREAE